MRKFGVMLAVLVVTVGLASFALPAPKATQTVNHTEWVAQSLKEIQTVKVGMTSEDFFKVFQPDGGISYGRYVYRQCNLFKVDVEFKNKKISKISKPYLEWPIED